MTTTKATRPARTDAVILAAARSDPDNPPREDRGPGSLGKPRARAFVIRRAFKMTQEQFCETFHIPLGTLRDWEQGRAEPDQAARAYLRVIAADREAVEKALGRKASAEPGRAGKLKSSAKAVVE